MSFVVFALTKANKEKEYLVVEFICHEWLGRGGPARPLPEVVLDEGAVSAVLEEARAPRHGSLEYLVTDHHEDVTWHGRVHACSKPANQ